MQKITEKRILVVDKQPLLSNGSIKGEITVSDTSLFRVGQIVTLSSDTKDNADYQVKRILKNTSISLGRSDKPIQDRVDVSAYKIADNAVMFAREQKRPPVPEQEIERHTYEEEPVVARRVVLIDKYGERYALDNPVPSIISDGEDSLVINPDGSVNVNIVNSTTVPESIETPFNEVTSVAKNVRTLVATLVAKNDKATFLQRITVGGTNFADYTLEHDDSKVMRKRTWAGSELHASFEFDGYSEKGKEILPGGTLKIYVEHARPFNGDFEVTFQVLEIG